MTLVKAERQKLKDFANEAFSSMPTLWRPSDTLRISYSKEHESKYCFDLNYRSNTYSHEGDDVTIYTLVIDTFEKRLHEEYVLVDPRYRGRGFGRQIVEAKHRLLTNFGFNKIPAVNVLDNDTAKGFWSEMGYAIGNDGIWMFDLAKP